MSHDPIEQRILDASLYLEASAGMRSRVLAAAMERIGPPATRFDRIWFSRRWRAVAAATAVAVVLLDRIASTPEPYPVAAPGAAAFDIGVAVADAARQAGLPTDQANAIAERAVIAAARPSRESLLKDAIGMKEWSTGEWR